MTLSIVRNHPGIGYYQQEQHETNGWKKRGMSRDDTFDNGPSTCDALRTLAGIITVIGATICTLDRIHR
ncbi:MAG TPA: hypothetical protein PLF04_09865 [Candidatus Fermentibacter daniensis]|jgi:hypothetical protein|nr:hypothetical protein [Deltaproteobacteria bacterium]HOZ18617.1 hypothetical protein [Candidatus Fermentibacter daniensis]HPH40495.1 hypothetical protein [Candidatus Fermentibacter daniensis]